MLKKWLAQLVVAAVAAVAALVSPPTAEAANCSLTGVSASSPESWRVNAHPYDYRVRGWGYISNPSTKLGCTVIVCVGEELGAGNWKGTWCINWVISAGLRNIHSQAPYVDCQTYAGTGWFRSYVRMAGGGVTLLGPPKKVC